MAFNGLLTFGCGTLKGAHNNGMTIASTLPNRMCPKLSVVLSMSHTINRKKLCNGIGIMREKLLAKRLIVYLLLDS